MQCVYSFGICVDLSPFSFSLFPFSFYSIKPNGVTQVPNHHSYLIQAVVCIKLLDRVGHFRETYNDFIPFDYQT